MSLTIVVFDDKDNFIQYLNPELIQIHEDYEQYNIRTVSIEYYVEGLSDYKNLFKIGNKIWISTDTNIPDCLYIINTEVANDLFSENNVVFEVEEKLVELNHVFFSQTDITTTTGTVTVNYETLKDFFGKYFEIGIVQNCLSSYMAKVTPTGTMSLMELLRYIEEETGNVFVPQYEKDINSNKINCFLNFLNPKSTSKQWELHLVYSFPTDERDEASEAEINESEDIHEDSDNVYFPEYVPETPLNPDEIMFRLTYGDKVLFEKEAGTLGFTGVDETYEFIFNYAGNNLKITVNNTITNHEVTIPNGAVFEMYNTETKRVVYAHKLYSKLGDTHEEILDLGFNAENINYTVNEEDTFIAIAPIINESDLPYDKVNDLIQNWLDLKVEKGQQIPMIIQKRTITGTEDNPCITINDAYARLGTFNLASNYYARPLKPNDSETKPTSDNPRPNNSFEFWVGTAYWLAPFNKLDDELYVVDDDITGVEYTHIQGIEDAITKDSAVSTPKTGSVETSDEDPYAIFNDVCMKLKDKRYPEINVEVDVANLIDGSFNEYNIFDKVFVKIPGFEKLITATVNKTEKNPLDVGENKVELTNFSVNKKVAQKKTNISSTNVGFTYPATSKLTAKLINSEYDSDNPDSIEFIPDRLLTFTIYSVENESRTLTDKIYTKKTDNNGSATINLSLEPGHYAVEITFGSDVEYAATTTSVDVIVWGHIEVAPKPKKTTTIKEAKKVKRYYSEYGVSPNKNHDTIVAIGRLSTGDKKKDKPYRITIFKRKCPDCGSTKLYWSIFWAKDKKSNIDENKSSGKFPATGKTVKGSHKGRVFCKKCGHSWNAIGESLSNGKKLKVHKKSATTTKAKAYELKNGNKVYDTVIRNVKVEKVLGNDGSEIDRNTSNTGKGYSGIISKKVREKAKSIVKNSTGIPAAKKIAKWVGKNIHHETRAGLYQSPATTLNRKKGNCLCQTDLFFQMCDAAGVTEKYTLHYIWVGGEKYGKRHFFGKINGKYVDVDAKPKNPWGHASFGKRSIRTTSKYPKLPLNRKYT